MLVPGDVSAVVAGIAALSSNGVVRFAPAMPSQRTSMILFPAPPELSVIVMDIAPEPLHVVY